MSDKQLYQNDPRWEKDVLGFGTTETIGQFGCLLTSMAIVGNHFGGSETPASLNSKLKGQQAFQGPWVKAFKIGAVFPDVQYQAHIECQNQDAPLDEIDAALAAGSLPVVRVDYSPQAGIQSHWIVIHQKNGDDYAIWDPYNNPNEPDTLSGRYGFAGKPQAIIQEAIIFGQGELAKSGSSKSTGQAKPAPKSSTTTTSDADLVVKPTVNGLTLRRQPRITQSNIVKHLSSSSKLAVLDASGNAQRNIGQQNQWLQVRDVEGDEGYVAAWYVTPVDDPAFGVQAQEEGAQPTTPTKLVVKTKASSVSLRSAPRVADETLITYLPFGTELLVTESGAAAGKVGVQNQWLAVQTVDGRKGYVAAWFVVKA